jgi:hypothetical protein
MSCKNNAKTYLCGANQKNFNMIQRIQTIFLFLAAAGNVALGLMPWAKSDSASPAGAFSDMVLSASDHIIAILAFFGAAIAGLVAIGLFSKRPRQIQMTRLSVLLTLGGAALLIWISYAEKAEKEMQMAFFLWIPVLLLDALAIRNISRDEKKVRAADRLR